MEKKIDRVETDSIFIPGMYSSIKAYYDKKNYKIERLIRDDAISQELDFKANIFHPYTIKITRLSDNSVKSIGFNDYCETIIQTYKNGVSHIIVIEYSGTSSSKLYDYIDAGNELELNNCYECRSLDKLKDTTYKINNQSKYNDGYVLYNLNKLSKPHTHIYTMDENAKERMKENYIMVKDIVVAENNHDIVDHLTYGIDLDTYNVVTPIHSTYQDDYFDLDSTDSLVEHLENEAKKKEKRKSLYLDHGFTYNKEFGDTFKRTK